MKPGGPPESTPRAPAQLPPPGLDGLDASWSRLVTTPDLDGADRVWHVLDNGADNPEITYLCVHGNPSWSYLWRHVIATAPPGVRVIAVDQLDMGFSERTGTQRRLGQRIEDLIAVTDQLDITTPVVPIAHDWGGPVALGWVMHNRERVAGVVLSNTAVHQPDGSPAPAIIRLARVPAVRRQVCVTTAAFIKGALRMSRPRPDKAVRDGYMAPYETADRRHAISAFVEDIPLTDDHPSAAILDEIAAGLAALHDTPVLLAWGPADPVFSDLYLRDFQRRLPHAETHRFLGASHFLHEEVDVASPIHAWVHRIIHPVPDRDEGVERPQSPALTGAIDARFEDPSPAIIEMHGEHDHRISFEDLASDTDIIATGLVAHGVQPGDRVALLIPPGIDLSVCLYACWRLGAVAVLADAALGPAQLSRALKSAAPQHLIGIDKALVAARAFGWPGRRVSVDPMRAVLAKALNVETSLDELRMLGAVGESPPPPADEDDAVVVFTSGSTGPSKGVVYKHHQLQAQRDALRSVTGVGPGDRLVAAFAPFALFGPALGLASVVPDMDVTAPGTLTASALAAAVRTIDATVVFASPAALRNVTATAGALTAEDHRAFEKIRLLMSAGAPVNAATLRQATALMPNATAATPYGMTELLPAAMITLRELDEIAATREATGPGVCVGLPVEGVLTRIAPFSDPYTLSKEPGVSGEVVLRARHAKDRYDQLWATQQATEQPVGWHRTGDVGNIDAAGRLWIEGRMVHVIATAEGPVTPVGIEHGVERLPDVAQAAAVGVGPTGAEVVVVVIQPAARIRRPALADLELLSAVRESVRSLNPDAPVDIASVLVTPELPTDKRHNSKIDRTRVAEWASAILAGGSIGKL